MIRSVHLHGEAGRRFGRVFRLDVASPAEAVRALLTLRPGLRAFMRPGNWRVIVGAAHLRNAIDAASLAMHAGAQAIHFVPVTNPRGGGDGGNVGKIVAGVIIIGAAIILSGGTLAAPLAGLGATAFAGITFGNIAALGVSMLAVGLVGLMTSAPTPQGGTAADTERARPEDRPSFLFNGVTNNSAQGGPVPLVFGRHLVGSVVVLAGIAAEDIAA